jgi:hypothetical protein
MAIEPNLPLELGERVFPGHESAMDKEWLKPILKA